MQKKSESKQLGVAKTSKGKLMFLSKFAVSDGEKQRFVKAQEACGLSFNLELKTQSYKINEIVKMFLLAGLKSMPEMRLRKPEFFYSVCRPFTKNKGKYKKVKTQKIQVRFIKNNWTQPASSTIWFMDISFNIYLE